MRGRYKRQSDELAETMKLMIVRGGQMYRDATLDAMCGGSPETEAVSRLAANSRERFRQVINSAIDQLIAYEDGTSPVGERKNA